MPITRHPQIFVAPSGKLIIYLTDIPQNGDILYSPDGSVLFMMVRTSFDGTPKTHDLVLEDPFNHTSGLIHREKSQIRYNNETYTLDPEYVLDVWTLVPLPVVRQPKYLCLTADGWFIYISAGKYDDSDSTFALFIGKGKTMRQIPIKHVVRYNNGCTYVDTAEGSFMWPSAEDMADSPKVTPMWGALSLRALSLDDYHIVETLDGMVTITSR